MVYLDFRSLCLIFAFGAWAGGRAGTWSHTAVDLRSLSLIFECGAWAGGAGRHLVPYSSRFTLTEPHRRHAARGPGGGPALGPIQQ
jgi:hypothetical protein